MSLGSDKPVCIGYPAFSGRQKALVSPWAECAIAPQSLMSPRAEIRTSQLPNLAMEHGFGHEVYQASISVARRARFQKVICQPYTYRRTRPHHPEKKDFGVCYNGEAIGRTYEDHTPHGAECYWAVFGINIKGVVADDIVRQGLADSFEEEARDRIEASLERLLTAGNVRLPGRR